MTQPVAERLAQAIHEVQERYYRIVLLVGQPRSGKTGVLRTVAESLDQAVINLNLVVSENLVALTKKQRALGVKRILLAELDRIEAEPILLDNIEILFDPGLAQDPMRLLQGLSRMWTIAAAWPGTYDGRYLTYAEPGHPEWRRYSQPDASIVAIQEGLSQPLGTQRASARAGAQEKR